MRFRPAAGTSLPVASATGKETQESKSPEGDTSPQSRSMCRPLGFQYNQATNRWLTPPAVHVSASGLCAIIGG